MATIMLGCDKNGVNDRGFQNTVAKILENAGNTVEKLEIDSNVFADYSYSSRARGKIGVFLIADGIFSIADASFGKTSFKYCYFGIRGDLPGRNMKSQNDFDTRPIGRDGDCTSICDRLAGKTYPQINEIVKNKSQAVFGKTAEEMGNNIVKAMGGEVSSSSKKTDSYSSCKNALTDVLYNWDGEAECFIRDDTVYIRKIPSPSTATLTLAEGQNIDLSSVNVSDYNPSTVNHLSCNFKDYILTIQDDYLIKRFGKISSTVKIDKSITRLNDAKQFLQREWNKLKRDNGHVLELKTYGHSKWKVGQWCRVYLPSFHIDDYMYIIRVSQDDDARNWDCSLTLVDYPPGFGEPSKTEEDNNKSSDST